MKTIYLAGPEVFLPEAGSILQDKKSLCLSRGFLALSPFDSAIPDNVEKNQDLARRIFYGNLDLIRRADIVLANCNPFRGPLVDDGTSFEIGYAYSLGKKIYGFAKSLPPLPENVKGRIRTFPHSSGYEIDEEGYLLNEDFGNSINLMLQYAIEDRGLLFEGEFEDVLRKIAEREQN
ncbi:nucleoside 2-deoxyribosyltransferase [Leptospira sp. 201903070]|uniref:Nucleoside 2-deoxyribosyltransferase n=1 Tax=Leptospira ainlahdjerensis TaxID=2810033 RepID=A0ABS2UEP8_9LEPT|nr:nucleoside 2-deoxyribosyltransferase [Leptospira ainlahdjerensis]MBM9578862.1 nucleoside 2-deoxyribosyltransferase [Leptospira ainlahdjerensis]